MQNSNIKTELTRKGKTITSAVMTLATAAVLTMTPMLQAFAYQKVVSESKPQKVKTFWWGGGMRIPVLFSGMAIRKLKQLAMPTMERFAENVRIMLAPVSQTNALCTTAHGGM